MSELVSARPTPLVLSHRGNMPGFVENTLGGFRAALAAGADVIESDVRVSRDGVPFLIHDETLERLAGDARRIQDVDSAELKALDLGAGEGAPSLEDVLVALPMARFNLDMKSPDAPAATASVLATRAAHQRVMLTTFSGRNRRKVHRLMPEVATSISADQYVSIALAVTFRLNFLVKYLLGPCQALQIPMGAYGLKTSSQRFIRIAHACNVDVHYWVINDEASMRLLLARGADGLVTDDVALARKVVTSRHAES